MNGRKTANELLQDAERDGVQLAFDSGFFIAKCASVRESLDGMRRNHSALLDELQRPSSDLSLKLTQSALAARGTPLVGRQVLLLESREQGRIAAARTDGLLVVSVDVDGKKRQHIMKAANLIVFLEK
jgi:hypothetical protein